MIVCLLAVGEVSGSSLLKYLPSVAMVRDTDGGSSGNALASKQAKIIPSTVRFQPKVA